MGQCKFGCFHHDDQILLVNENKVTAAADSKDAPLVQNSIDTQLRLSW